MNAQEFCYWLQGFIEVQRPESLTKEQTQMVKDHLKLVFTKVTPERKEQLSDGAITEALNKALRRIKKLSKTPVYRDSHIDMNRTYC